MMHQEEKIKYFLYARKSQDGEDRQVASTDSQIYELKKLAAELGFEIIEIFTEERTAKKPGRPIFNDMLERLQNGEAGGILCWKLDRLARNPIDGGQIIWMLQENTIKHIRTIDRNYYPIDNILMMSIEFGMATQYSRDLAMNVKRGMEKRVREGWLPTRAPMGYLNTPDREQGRRIILDDPDRFPLVRRMWDLMLTGTYSARRICEIANNEWGFRSFSRKRREGKLLSYTGIYQIFSNSFYSGWFEYPKGSGIWFQGAHTPMVTQDEFAKVQTILGRKEKSKLYAKAFAFNGLIRCGECGCSITAEEKNQIICSNCKCKFAYQSRKICPKCGTTIGNMENPTILKYVYYHCTKKRRKLKCTQGAIEVTKLLKQIDDFLQSIQIEQTYLEAAIKSLRSTHSNSIETQEAKIRALQKTCNSIHNKLKNLFDMRLSGDVTQNEYVIIKSQLTKEYARYEQLVQTEKSNPIKWIEFTEQFFEFAAHAHYWFVDAIKNNNLQAQREILASIGSNLILKDKILLIAAIKPFNDLQDVLKSLEEKNDRLEPEKNAVKSWVESPFTNHRIPLSALVNKVRTWYKSLTKHSSPKIYSRR